MLEILLGVVSGIMIVFAPIAIVVLLIIAYMFLLFVVYLIGGLIDLICRGSFNPEIKKGKYRLFRKNKIMEELNV